MMSRNAPKPPGHLTLERMAAQIRAEKRKQIQEQAAPPDVLEAQLLQENALRKMLQKMSDQRNGH